MAANLSSDDEKLLREVREKFTAADKAHKNHRRQFEHWHALYWNYSDWTAYQRDARPNNVDQGLREAQREFGAILFVPIGFWTVETVLPRLLSQSPRMLVMPRDQDSEQNAENMRLLVEAQQQRMRYQVVLQDVGKDGLIYGLGVQKLFWRKETRKTKKIAPATVGTEGAEFSEVPATATVWDDPDAEAVDVFDFFWDPLGYDMRTVSYVIHRTWRSTEYVLKRFKSGDWDRHGMTDEDVKGMGPRNREYDTVWARRMEAAGHGKPDDRGSQVHEVWELHSRDGLQDDPGKQVVTVLDREVPVQVGANPAWHGQLPFQIYRPTRVNKHFVGRGEIEPLEHLQEEMNTLRSQRRDAATIALAPPMAFANGMVDPADMVWGPNIAWPVDGDPREVLHQFQVKDIPASGYQEEDRLWQDIQRTSGISDSVTGAEGGGITETATGAQLVHAAANVRIQNKTRLMEMETITDTAEQQVALNQQRIVTQRSVTIPVEPTGPDPNRRWTYRMLGPKELMGEFAIVPLGGSTAPDNVPQMIQEAQAAMTLFGQNPGVDQRRLLEWALRKFRVEDPQSWMSAPGSLPPQMLDYMRQALITAKGPHSPEDADSVIRDALGKTLSNGQPQQQAVR